MHEELDVFDAVVVVHSVVEVVVAGLVEVVVVVLVQVVVVVDP